jgi:hypothetical protein
MKSAVVASTFLGVASAAVLAPKEATPAGCSTSYDSSFEITVAQVTYQKRDIQVRRQVAASFARSFVTDTYNVASGNVRRQWRAGHYSEGWLDI